MKKNMRVLAVAFGGIPVFLLFFNAWVVVRHGGDDNVEASGFRIATNTMDGALSIRYAEIRARRAARESLMSLGGAPAEQPPPPELRNRPRKRAVPELLLVPVLAVGLAAWGFARFKGPAEKVSKEAAWLCYATAAVLVVVCALRMATWRQGGPDGFTDALADPYGTLVDADGATPQEQEIANIFRKNMTVRHTTAFWVTLVFLFTTAGQLALIRWRPDPGST